MFKKNRKPINWVTTLFLIINPIVAIVGTITLICHHQFYWQTGVLGIALAALCGLSVTAGYHRLFSHQTYQSVWFIRLLYVLFGAATFEGSVLEWCSDHRNHHLYTDTPKDPYNFKQGFWYAHMGWLFTLDPKKRNFENIPDLTSDPMLRFQHKFYIPIALLIGYGLPVAMGLLWGDWLGGLLIAGALRITFSQQTTFFINSICHAFGKLTYSDQYTAKDNWITALFTFGEGYHNFHHKFPKDYRNAIRFYQYDPTKWFIRLLSYCKLASHLKTMSNQKILEYKLMMDKKRLAQLAEQKALEHNTLLHTLYNNLIQLLSNTDKLEKAYKQLKATQLNHHLLRHYKTELKLSKAKLKHMTKAWSYLVKDHLILNLGVQIKTPIPN